ncbi:MAG: DUF308 domain-containing protein [Actinomycetota bacterium]|nr:DUF308 domain-containing protein [Actinomycetota bacterium]
MSAWVAPALRAIVALAVGFAITFTPAHSAAFGLVAFGSFAVVAGAVLLAGSFGSRGDASSRGLFLTQGVVTVLAGIAALVLPEGGVHYLVFVVSAWAIVTGALELVSGIRARTRLPAARDWMILGGLTLLLAIGFLVVPPDYTQTLGGIEQIKGQLTASVVLVGMFGAWAIVAGVLLGISAVSARGARAASPIDRTVAS